MADFIKNPVVPLPEREPEPHFSEAELVFSDEEKKQIAVCLCKHTKTPPFCDGSHANLSV